MSKMLKVELGPEMFEKIVKVFKKHENTVDNAKWRIAGIAQNDMELSPDDIVNFINEYQECKDQLQKSFNDMMKNLNLTVKEVIKQIKEDNE